MGGVTPSRRVLFVVVATKGEIGPTYLFAQVGYFTHAWPTTQPLAQCGFAETAKKIQRQLFVMRGVI